MFYVSAASRFSPSLPLLSFTFGPIPSPESNWLVTHLTHGRWSARLYQICLSYARCFSCLFSSFWRF